MFVSGGGLSARQQFYEVLRFYMIFPNFLRSQVFSRSAIREAPCIYHVHYNQASLHLLLNENLLNHQSVSKYYEHDCGSCWTGDNLVSFETHLGHI